MALCLHIGVTALVGTGGADGILSTHGSHDVGGWLWWRILPAHWGHRIGGWLCLMHSAHTRESQRWCVALMHSAHTRRLSHNAGEWLCLVAFYPHIGVTALAGGSV